MLYVATTPHGEPLERLAVQGLAFRGVARIEVAPRALVLRDRRRAASFLPADRIVSAPARRATRSTAAVEPEGLVAVTWIARRRRRAGGPHVDSYLSARSPGDSARIIAAVNDIAAARPRRGRNRRARPR